MHRAYFLIYTGVLSFFYDVYVGQCYGQTCAEFWIIFYILHILNYIHGPKFWMTWLKCIISLAMLTLILYGYDAHIMTIAYACQHVWNFFILFILSLPCIRYFYHFQIKSTDPKTRLFCINKCDQNV